MKMLVIATDGHGAFRCGVVKNPDLFRRDIAMQTGASYVIWAGAPILSTDAGQVLDRITRLVLPRFTAGPELQHNLAFLAGVSWATLGRPVLAWSGRRLRHRVSRTIRRLGSIGRVLTFPRAGEEGGQK